MATGITYQPVKGQCGVIFKVNADGDSTWLRYYQAPELNPNLNTNVLFHIQATADSGFIACGYMLPDDTTNQDMWVIKVDKYGCLEDGCELVGTEELSLENNRFEVYPNPTNGEFTIQLTGVEQGAMDLYDILGKQHYAAKLPNAVTRLQIDCLADGIYLLKVTDSTGKNFATKRILVIK